jgi:serine/threonine protein kinase
MTDLTGHELGRYHLLEKLGEGGMAIVYKAYDTRLEVDVAVKVIQTESLPQNAIERALKRFEREAKALARLTHQNIVKVTDYGEYEGKPYLVMPYLPGRTLKQKMDKPMPWQEAVQLLLPIAKALGYAHSQNIIHRDVKPSNILLTQSGQPMLADFGIAKMLELEETLDLTGTSAAVGTPEYMAPEQANAKTVDHRADIYALGIVLFEMVTGRKPFVADTPMAVLIKQATEPLPNPKQFAPNLPDQAVRIIVKALAKKPGDRYQRMAEFSNILEKTINFSFR